jgi:hypothetical protein
MFRVLKIAAIACVAALAGMSEAQAGIPIPCTGDKIVKVADMPKSAMPDGTKVDLGYMFQWCFTGKWVGYIGSDRRYLDLPDHMLGAMAILAGFTELPPAPSFWAKAWENKWQFFAEWLWLLLLSIAACGLASNKLLYGTFAHPRSTVEATPAPAHQAAAAKAAPVAPHKTAAAPQRSTAAASSSPAAARMARVLKPATGGPAGAMPTLGRR